MGMPAAVLCLALVCLPYAAALLGSGSVEEAQAVIPWVVGLGGQVCFHSSRRVALAGDSSFFGVVTPLKLCMLSQLTWFSAQAHVKIGHNSAGVRATLASRSIKAGEVVIHVPANLTITLATVSEHLLAVSARLPVESFMLHTAAYPQERRQPAGLGIKITYHRQTVFRARSHTTTTYAASLMQENALLVAH